MKYLLLFLSFIMLIIPQTIDAKDKTSFIKAFEREKNIYNSKIEVPKDVDIEIFSNNIISAISQFKENELLVSTHYMLNFILWHYSNDVLAQIKKHGIQLLKEDKILIGWKTLYQIAKAIDEEGDCFKIFHIVKLYDFLSKENENELDDFTSVYAYGELVSPYFYKSKEERKKVDTYQETIKELLN